MQFGFVIDHSRCIGCHACTVACKAENDVPVGSFRTWVKYTEEGTFPEVRRSFAVLRCNQCSDAPCITICPVRALKKRPDGIVDVDPALCIGCKGCLQACPYDALYINDASGTAEKCHFCAHRVERGLAPACAVVCPTEAIIPGDFDDPKSSVSRMRASGQLTARKPEAGTGPNVLYREADPAGLDPLATNAGGGYLWANPLAGPQLDAQIFEALEHKATARTVYDVEHPPAWGARVSAYLFTKSLAAGAMLAGAAVLPPFSLGGILGRGPCLWIVGLAFVFWAMTNALLVADLKRPGRCFYILLYGNPDSWITRGAWVLAGYAAVLAAFAAAVGFGDPGAAAAQATALLSVPSAALAAGYTAWLFGQARGRVLWLRRDLALLLVLHAVVGGAALLVLVLPRIGAGAAGGVMRWVLAVAVTAGPLLELFEGRFRPARRGAEYERAARLLSHGPYALRRRVIHLAIPAILLLLIVDYPATWQLGALLALVALYVEQDTYVRAGQAPRIS